MGINTTGAVLLHGTGDLSALHSRVAELLQDYNPELELQYIPENDRSSFDARPFRVVHNSPNGAYVVGYFRQDEVNEKLIAHIFKHDRKNRDILTDLEDEEAAREALLMREQLDKQEEAREIAQSMIKSKKDSYRINGRTYKGLL
jgi:hypothetical protein